MNFNLSSVLFLPRNLKTLVCHPLKSKVLFDPENKLLYKYICLTSLPRAKCGVRSTLCWKIPNISGSIELFAL